MQIPTLEDQSPGARPIITDVFRGGGQEGAAKSKAAQAWAGAIGQIAKTFRMSDKIDSNNRVNKVVTDSESYLDDALLSSKQSGIGGQKLIDHFRDQTIEFDKQGDWSSLSDSEKEKARNILAARRNEYGRSLSKFSLMQAAVNRENAVTKSLRGQIKATRKNPMGSMLFQLFYDDKTKMVSIPSYDKMEGKLKELVKDKYLQELKEKEFEVQTQSKDPSDKYLEEYQPATKGPGKHAPSFEEWFEIFSANNPELGAMLDDKGKPKPIEDTLPELDPKSTDPTVIRNRQRYKQLKVVKLFEAAISHYAERLASAKTKEDLDAVMKAVPILTHEGFDKKVKYGGRFVDLNPFIVIKQALKSNEALLSERFMDPGTGKPLPSAYENLMGSVLQMEVKIEERKHKLYTTERKKVQTEFDGYVDEQFKILGDGIDELQKQKLEPQAFANRLEELNTKFKNSLEDFDTKGYKLNRGKFLDRSKVIDKDVSNAFENSLMKNIVTKASNPITQTQINTLRNSYQNPFLTGKLSMEAATRVRNFAIKMTDYRMTAAFRKQFTAMQSRLLARMNMKQADLNKGYGPRHERYWLHVAEMAEAAEKDNFQKSAEHYYDQLFKKTDLTTGTNKPGETKKGLSSFEKGQQALFNTSLDRVEKIFRGHQFADYRFDKIKRYIEGDLSDPVNLQKLMLEQRKLAGYIKRQHKVIKKERMDVSKIDPETAAGKLLKHYFPNDDRPKEAAVVLKLKTVMRDLNFFQEQILSLRKSSRNIEKDNKASGK